MEALEKALCKAKPEIFNTDQGSQADIHQRRCRRELQEALHVLDSGKLQVDMRSLCTLLDADRWPPEHLNAFLSNSYDVDPLVAFKNAVELIETHIDFPVTEAATVVALWAMSTYLL